MMNSILALKLRLESIFKSLFPHYFADRFIKRMQTASVKLYGGYDAHSHIIENCEYFLPKEKLENPAYMEKLVHDIVYSYIRYGTNANEYFCYNFPALKGRERDKFLPRQKKDSLLIKQMGKDWKVYFGLIKDKYSFYKLAKEFFKRDVCEIKSKEDFPQFSEFISKYRRVIVKPVTGGSGAGVQIIDLAKFGSSIEAFEHLMQSNSHYVVEELIEQDCRMAEWNSSSINTIRVPSFINSSGHTVIYPSIRIGRAGFVVDNAGCGGTFAALDPCTGEIISKGFDKRGNSYDVHPDSKKRYLGAKIPMWKELLDFVQNMHRSLPPQHRYIAFDVALSTKGWVVVEANWGEMTMPQIEFSKGLYEDFKHNLTL